MPGARSATRATELYSVRSYEIDTQGQVTVPALCNYLQESAGLHARQLGVSVEQLLGDGMTWFLWRLHLQVLRWPRWTDIVAVETWPSELGRPFAIRDFVVRIDDQDIGVATSAWLLMDTVKGKPIRRLPPRIRDIHPDPPRRALQDPFHRLPACQDPMHSQDSRVRRSDLDLNGHLNHVAAINAMLEVVPQDVAESHRLTSLEVEFKGEGYLGDGLKASAGPEDAGDSDILVHLLKRATDNKELARGRSRWSRR